LLEEAYRLLEAEAEDTDVYILNQSQRDAIKEAQHQIRDGKFFTNNEADNLSDEWLKE